MKHKMLVSATTLALILAGTLALSGVALASPGKPGSPADDNPAPVGPAGPHAPSAPGVQTGCFTAVDSGLAIDGKIGNTTHNGENAYVLLTTVGSQTNVPAFCTDMLHDIASGDCFSSGGATSPQIAYILNHYPAATGLTNNEASARQAAVWWFSDSFTVTSPSAVKTRSNQIISDTLAHYASDPAVQIPVMSLAPAGSSNQLPANSARKLTLTATRGGSPIVGLQATLTTSFGALNTTQVTTTVDGTAIFTITSSVTGTAYVTASATYTLPAGTQLIALQANKQQLVLAKPNQDR